MEFLGCILLGKNVFTLSPILVTETLAMRTFLTKLLRDQTGPTAIEYGLIAALIAVVTIAGLTTLGTTLNSRYNAIATDIGS
jgi:pilus assembly protein Flp/PilA